MRYYYNQNYGIILYPDNWWDTLRCLFILLILPKFKRTWKGNFRYFYYPHMAGCIECKLKETNYPDEATGG